MRGYCVWWLSTLVVSLLLTGCMMVELRPRPPIPVPPNLSDEDAEIVVLFALADLAPPAEWTPGERIADNALQAAFGRAYQSAQIQGKWFPEAIEPGLITAGFNLGQFYLRVALRIRDHGVEMRLLDSKNLNQEGTKIHQSALVWLDGLETAIRRALGNEAARRRLMPRLTGPRA